MSSPTDAVAVALGFVGTRTGQPAVAKFLGFVSLKAPNAWCLAFALFCAHSANPAGQYPKLARCSMFWHTVKSNAFRFDAFTPQDVAWGIKQPQRNDIAIFSHGGSATDWSGHAATVVGDLGHGKVATIEGNTSPTSKGDQRMGGVVAIKVRAAGVRSFLLQGFVRPRA